MHKENKKHLEGIYAAMGSEFDPIPFLQEARRVLKKVNMVVFMNNNTVYEYLKFAHDHKLKYNIHTMTKTNPVPTFKGKFLDDIEYIVYLFEGGRYFDSTQGYKSYFRNHVVSTSDFAKANKKYQHPSVKPLWIIEKYIKILCPLGGTVLDPYVGSGTTVVAAKKLGRKSLGIEIDPKFAEVARKRVENPEEG